MELVNHLIIKINIWIPAVVFIQTNNISRIKMGKKFDEKYEIPKSQFNKKCMTCKIKGSIKFHRRILNKILKNGIIDHFTRWYKLAT